LRSVIGWLSAASALLPGVAFAGETQVYTYDALGRLTAVQYSGTVNNGQAHSLCYDPAGNRTKYRSSASGVIAACPGQQVQLLSTEPPSAIAAAGTMPSGVAETARQERGE
jgi:hypothetical protein